MSLRSRGSDTFKATAVRHLGIVHMAAVVPVY